MTVTTVLQSVAAYLLQPLKFCWNISVGVTSWTAKQRQNGDTYADSVLQGREKVESLVGCQECVDDNDVIECFAYM